MMTDENNPLDLDFFPELSHKVLDLIAKVRVVLFNLDAKEAVKLNANCSQLNTEIRQAESACNDSLLVGISSNEERFLMVGYAQCCSRLRRVVHQVSTILQGVQDLSGHIDLDALTRFKPLFLIAEVELKDAILSILRNDEKLAYAVRSKDKELDSLYQQEQEYIFKSTSEGMRYNFQTATSLLFILRAIERIGDHAKNLAVPSFFMLAPGR